MTEIAVTFGLAFAIVFYYVYTKDLLDKPSDSLNKEIWSYVRFKDMAVFVHVLGAYMIVGLIGFLLIISTGEAYYTAIETFFIAFSWLVTGVFIIYLAIYIIFRIKEELTGSAAQFSKGGRK